MASTREKLEITPKLIDLGDEIIAVRQIARASCVSGHPFRLAGVAGVLLAVAAIGYEVALGQGLGAIQAGGSTPMWMAFLAAGIGIFATVYQRRALIITGSDGYKVVLSGTRDAFLREVVARIGEAINAPPGEHLHYIVDFKAGTVRPIMAAMNPPAGATGHHVPQSLPQQQRPAATLTAPGQRDPLATATASDWNGAAPINGHPAHLPHVRDPIVVPNRGPDPYWASASWSAPQAPGDALPRGANATGANAAGPHAAMAAATVPQPKRELEALIALVMRSDIQHKAALLDLLNVVDDHMQGGQTDSADARAHWDSFSGYVEQYLADITGLVPMTRRVGRTLPLH